MVRKIIHVQLLPLLSGVQRVSLNEISTLINEKSLTFSLSASEEGDLTERCKSLGVKYYVNTHLVRSLSPWKDMLAFFEYLRLFNREKFDIVHTHSSKPGFLARIAAKISGVNMVMHTVHGFAFPSTNNRLLKCVYFFMEFVAARFTDHLIVLNDSDYCLAIDKLKYPKRKVSVVANGIDTDLFSPLTAPKTKVSCIKIVMVGRLWKQKNPLCLLKAVNDLVKKGYSLKLDFIGDGELKTELEKFIYHNKLEDCVSLLGWKDDLHKLLPDYDVFVLPSLWEGMPLAIIEALSCGIPSIVSNIPGNRDVIEDGVDGLIFSKGDDRDLGTKIIRLIEDPVLRQSMSIQARYKAVDKYSLSRRNEIIKGIYSSN